jgi:hypothetical protein
MATEVKTSQNGATPQNDDFNYEAIEQEMYAPDTELTMYGAEMMQIKGRLEKFLHDNTQAVFGPENQPIGHFMQPYAQPIAELYGMIYRTMNFDDYKKSMQTKAMEAEEAENQQAEATTEA